MNAKVVALVNGDTLLCNVEAHSEEAVTLSKCRVVMQDHDGVKLPAWPLMGNDTPVTIRIHHIVYMSEIHPNLLNMYLASVGGIVVPPKQSIIL
jgi:hypothetical protein